MLLFVFGGIFSKNKDKIPSVIDLESVYYREYAPRRLKHPTAVENKCKVRRLVFYKVRFKFKSGVFGEFLIL